MVWRSAKISGSDALLYILWEHQSSEAPLMGLRLLSYMVRIWQRQAQEGGQSTKLSPILPLVLAQDKDRWKTSTHFHDLFTFPQADWAAVRACTRISSSAYSNSWTCPTRTSTAHRKAF